MAKNNYNISQTVEIIPVQVAKAYTIPKSDWNYIKAKICKIKTGGSALEAFGYLFLGSSISCLIGYLTTKELDSKINVGIILLTFIIGALCLIFRYVRKVQENCKPADVIEFMNMVESKFKADIPDYDDI